MVGKDTVIEYIKDYISLNAFTVKEIKYVRYSKQKNE